MLEGLCSANQSKRVECWREGDPCDPRIFKSQPDSCVPAATLHYNSGCQRAYFVFLFKAGSLSQWQRKGCCSSSAKMVNVLHTALFQHLHKTPTGFTKASRSPIHTPISGHCHARGWQPHWKQLGLSVLPKDTTVRDRADVSKASAKTTPVRIFSH